MPTALEKHETLQQDLFNQGLDFQLQNWGLDIEVRRREDANPGDNEYNFVYGEAAGDVLDPTDTVLVATVKGIISSDAYTVTDDASIGLVGMSDIYLFSDSALFKNGDVLTVIRSKSRRYKVIDKESVGQTATVVYKYKLSSIGD